MVAHPAAARAVEVSQQQITGGADLGSTLPGSISGRVDDDETGNGAPYRDGEIGLGGFTVYADLNSDGRFEDGEPNRPDRRFRAVLHPRALPAGLRSPRRQAELLGADHARPAGGRHQRAVPHPRLRRVQLGGTDFGLIRPNYFAGRIYNDADASGSPDAGEAGLGGWLVFADTNGNGQEDTGEPYAVSGSSGNYPSASPSTGRSRSNSSSAPGGP